MWSASSHFARLRVEVVVMQLWGGLGSLFNLAQAGYDLNETVLVSGTDGVGTKLKIAQSIGKHSTIGIDLVAMCVNDILVCGAEPLFFLDYFACGQLDVDIASEVVKGIAAGCAESGCALIGGETAEMAGMYSAGEYDLAGFSVGAVRRQHLLPKGIALGDTSCWLCPRPACIATVILSSGSV